MSILNRAIKAAVLAAAPTFADASPIHDSGMGSLLNVSTASTIDTVDPRVAGRTILGQARIEGQDPTALTQVFQVRQDFDSACAAPSAPKTAQAFSADVYDAITQSGSLNTLASVTAEQTVDITTLKRNAPYAYPLEGDNFDLFRAQAGFGIEKATVFIGDEMLDISALQEPSNYTVKFVNDLQDKIKDAYLAGEPVTFVYLSDLGHTMVDSYQIDADVEQTFEDCLDEETNNVPVNQYFSIQTTPVVFETPAEENAMISTLIGQQCLRGKVEESSVAGIEVIESVTSGFIPYGHALRMNDGSMIVADYLKIDRNGDVHLSRSLQQYLQNAVVSSCAGTETMPKPPVFVADVPSTPVAYVPYTPFVPSTPYRPGGGTPWIPGGGTPWIPGDGCKHDCNPPPVCETDCTPPPSPVPLPAGLVLMLTGLAGLGAARVLSRRPEEASAAPKPQTFTM